MYTRRFSRHLATIGGLLASTIAMAQDTSISYQGYVTNNGSIIQGPTNYQMTFSLYANLGDIQPVTDGVIGPITVSVEKSLFSVPLAFPTSVWTGADRYLEVQIGNEILNPRQKIRWAPYAIYALNAADRNSLDASDGVPADAVFVDAGGFAGFGTTTPQARLHVSNDSIWLGGTDALGFAAAAGPGMRFFNTATESNINAADYGTSTPRPLVLQHQGGSVGIGGLPATGNRLDVTGQVEMDAFKMATGAAAGRVLTSDANGLGTWQAAPGGNGVWSTIGTADIANTNTGNVGIGTGTNAPAARLHVIGEPQSVPAAALENDDLIVEADDATIGLYSSPGGNAASAIAFKEINAGALVDTWGIYRRTTGGGASLRFSYGLTDNYANNATLVQINSNGNFGIGTTAPAQKLSVAGTIQSTTGGFMFPDGTTQATAAGSSFWAGSGNNNISNTNSGNVGVGTNLPGALLHVRRDQNAPTILRLENVNNTPTASAQMLFQTGSDNGFFETAILSLESGAAGGVFNITTGDIRAFSTTFAVSGLLGGFIDVESRAAQAGRVYVRNTADEAVVQLAGGGNNDSGEIRLYRLGQTAETVEIMASDAAGQGAAIRLRQGNGTDGVYINAEETLGGGAAVSLYNPSGVETIKLDGDYQGTGVGRVITDVLEITGADLAEKFPTSEQIAPGMVVAIDEVNEGKLCLARGAYNRTVAGVVSGAKDFSVGAILGSRTESDDGPPIALAGRVYVWCDADAAPIKPGDLLTTSDVPGHAMKVLDHDAAQGAILGKAMGSLEKGSGLVLVLVNLQ